MEIEIISRETIKPWPYSPTQIHLKIFKLSLLDKYTIILLFFNERGHIHYHDDGIASQLSSRLRKTKKPYRKPSRCSIHSSKNSKTSMLSVSISLSNIPKHVQTSTYMKAFWNNPIMIKYRNSFLKRWCPSNQPHVLYGLLKLRFSNAVDWL